MYMYHFEPISFGHLRVIVFASFFSIFSYSCVCYADISIFRMCVRMWGYNKTNVFWVSVTVKHTTCTFAVHKCACFTFCELRAVHYQFLFTIPKIFGKWIRDICTVSVYVYKGASYFFLPHDARDFKVMFVALNNILLLLLLLRNLREWLTLLASRWRHHHIWLSFSRDPCILTPARVFFLRFLYQFAPVCSVESKCTSLLFV